MMLYEVCFVINDGDMVEFRVETSSRNKAIMIAASMLDPSDVIQDHCVGIAFGSAA